MYMTGGCYEHNDYDMGKVIAFAHSMPKRRKNQKILEKMSTMMMIYDRIF